ncbi:EVE domain-containing protein [Mixta theicola]|nr:EVE domain-containing protein [Mixta theicola]GLR08434.1 UPF0310 protein [Mixta theicola]
MARYWCGVVSREHIKFGEQGGFCQVCHGKRAPLARMAVGDGIVFYSPVVQFRGKEKCQSFTAIGTVIGEETYQFQMTPTFVPYRRDVAYQPCIDAPIHPLLDRLSFTKGLSSWGYKFRFGHFEITDDDFSMIAQAMLPDSAQTVLNPAIQAQTSQNLDLFYDQD